MPLTFLQLSFGSLRFQRLKIDELYGAILCFYVFIFFFRYLTFFLKQLPSYFSCIGQCCNADYRNVFRMGVRHARTHTYMHQEIGKTQTLAEADGCFIILSLNMGDIKLSSSNISAISSLMLSHVIWTLSHSSLCCTMRC